MYDAIWAVQPGLAHFMLTHGRPWTGLAQPIVYKCLARSRSTHTRKIVGLAYPIGLFYMRQDGQPMGQDGPKASPMD